MQRRHEPEERRRHQREPEREHEDGRVDPRVVDAGTFAGDNATTPCTSSDASRSPASPAPPASTQLSVSNCRITPPAGAERGAQRDLARPARGPRQQEVRDIRAPNEPDDADGAHQHPQRRLEAAGEPLLQRNHGRSLEAVLGILPCERVANGPHLRLRAREVRFSLELPDGLVRVVAAVRSVVGRAHGRPDIRGTWIAESRRRHPDDLHRVAVDRDRLSDRGPITAEVSRGPVIRHDGGRGRALSRRDIVLCQQASRGRALAEHREELGRDVP